MNIHTLFTHTEQQILAHPAPQILRLIVRDEHQFLRDQIETSTEERTTQVTSSILTKTGRKKVPAHPCQISTELQSFLREVFSRNASLNNEELERFLESPQSEREISEFFCYVLFDVVFNQLLSTPPGSEEANTLLRLMAHGELLLEDLHLIPRGETIDHIKKRVKTEKSSSHKQNFNIKLHKAKNILSAFKTHSAISNEEMKAYLHWLLDDITLDTLLLSLHSRLEESPVEEETYNTLMTLLDINLSTRAKKTLEDSKKRQTPSEQLRGFAAQLAQLPSLLPKNREKLQDILQDIESSTEEELPFSVADILCGVLEEALIEGEDNPTTLAFYDYGTRLLQNILPPGVEVSVFKGRYARLMEQCAIEKMEEKVIEDIAKARFLEHIEFVSTTLQEQFQELTEQVPLLQNEYLELDETRKIAHEEMSIKVKTAHDKIIKLTDNMNAVTSFLEKSRLKQDSLKGEVLQATQKTMKTIHKV